MALQMTCSKSVALTQVDDYFDLIMNRNKLCGWGFTRKDAAKLRKLLKGHKHENPLMPIGVDIWLGKNLQYNLKQATNWLNDEMVRLSHKLIVYTELNDLSFLTERKRQDLSIEIVELDFETFRNPSTELSIKRVLSSRKIWPGLEIIWFLALNPQILINMDGEKIPYLQVPGLIIRQSNKYSVPEIVYVYHDEDFVYIWNIVCNCSKFASIAAYVLE